MPTKQREQITVKRARTVPVIDRYTVTRLVNITKINIGDTLTKEELRRYIDNYIEVIIE